MNYRTLTILTVTSILFLLACQSNNRGEWTISDLSKDTTLLASTNVKSPTTLILHITGAADDSLKVNSVPIPGGTINEELRLDQYHQNIKINVESYRAKTSKIKIAYHLPGSSLY